MKTGKTLLTIVTALTSALLLVASCAVPSMEKPAINVVKEAGLSDTVRIEIAEMVEKPELDYLHRVTITDPHTIDQIVATLNQDFQLDPRARCPAHYQLRFHLGDSTVQELGYRCDNGRSFLRGDQAFWQLQDLQPPAQFDELILEALASTE